MECINAPAPLYVYNTTRWPAKKKPIFEFEIILLLLVYRKTLASPETLTKHHRVIVFRRVLVPITKELKSPDAGGRTDGRERIRNNIANEINV